MQSLNSNHSGYRFFRLLIATVSVGSFLWVACSTSNQCWAQTTNQAKETIRSIGDFRKDLKTFMKLSKSDEAQQVRNAIYNLCQLHQEIVSDSRFATSSQLPSFRAVIAKRLETFSKDHKNALLRQERELKKERKKLQNELESNSENPESSETSERSSESDRPDRQDGDNESDETETGESVTLGSSSSAPSSDSSTDYGDSSNDESLAAMQDAAAESYYSMGAASGGPNQIFDYAGRLGPPWDHGEELVDLIVNTIDPAFWRRNGGNGSIHYYRPSRVLVVRAPQQGHDEASDLLNKLRGANGNQLNIGGNLGGAGN